jgi:hypothetical protein
MSRKSISATAIAAAALLVTFGTSSAQYPSSTQSQGTTSTQPSVSGQASGGASVGADTMKPNASGSVQGSVTTDSPSASPNTMSTDEESAKARGLDPDKKTGLDRADEAAGTKGQQGRDNAREKQEQR